jgi:hypothetical protein
MKIKGELCLFLILFFGLLFCQGCDKEPAGNTENTGRMPVIAPDYTDVTIPPNIAAMNFVIREEGTSFKISATSEGNKYKIILKSSDGIVRFPERAWKKIIGDSRGGRITIRIYSSGGKGQIPKEYEPVYMNVADEPVDGYLTYRLIYPGYYSWSNIKIVQRSIESFEEESLIENQILEMNCVNCHSFNQYNPGKFLVHIRGSKGGTYFVEKDKITRRDLKIDAMPGGATYPSWHPGGRYVAFSSNQVRQHFYSEPSKSIEVFDLVSDMILFDIEKNDIVLVKDADTTGYQKTFPSWSPDGRYLYYCRVLQGKIASTVTMEDLKSTRYDIVRQPFEPESGSFGEPEIVVNASGAGKSASFPRVSPDGRFLVYTLHDYGTFPMWHREADLHILDLQSGESRKMELNSNETESYHTWSSNSSWLVFSSKRTDGRSTRPFLAYIDSQGRSGKPFILPQRDPSRYDKMLESLSLPEFVAGRIVVSPRDFVRAAKNETIKAIAGEPPDSIPRWDKLKINAGRNPGETSIHE